MDISNDQKAVLKAIGAKEMTFSQLQRKLGENFPVGSEIQVLGQMGLVEEADGYLFVTDVGIRVAAIEGNEIPERLEQEMNATVKQAGEIKIQKPGEAMADYRKGAGIKDPDENEAMRQYREGLARQQGKPVNPRSARYEPAGDTEDAEHPEGPADEEEVVKPVLEAAEEHREPEAVREIRGHNACPIFGSASINFCVAMCAGWDNGCGVTDKMAERMKP